MRPYALAILVLGLAGMVIGVIHLAVPGHPAGADSGEFGFATWRGIGPLMAGFWMVVASLWALRRRPML
jgi:hypothetical protein